MMSKELKGLPIVTCKQQAMATQLSQQVYASQPYQQALASATHAQHPLHNSAMQGYQAWLGFYNSNMKVFIYIYACLLCALSMS